jgi:hypothetical protein
MNTVLFSASVVFVFLGIAFFLLFKRLASLPAKPEFSGDFENLFSPKRYTPMERLLDAADYRFVESQLGHDGRRMLRRFRAGRVSIFKGYARCLRHDFGRISNALKALMIHAPTDRSGLAGLILKQRFIFNMNMLSLQFRLALHSRGLSTPKVDVRELLGALDTMRAQLRALAATAQPSLA